MAGLDDLLQPQDNRIPGADFTFQDADTVKLDQPVDGVNGVRLRGVLAPETGRKTGEVGGTMTTQQVIDLANSMGYTEVVYDTNERDDTGTRFVGDLQDKHGRSFARALASEGILGVSDEHDTLGLRGSQEYGAFLRTEEGRDRTEWDEARDMIADSVQSEQRYENQFLQKQLIAGDARYAPDLYTSLAADFEYDDRSTATGKSNNPFSDAWDVGLIGVKEASYGILNLLGESTDIDGLSDIGQAGINRAQTQIQDRGHFITDYKDVKGFGDAIEYVTNNAALSLPYMAISFAGAAAAPITGGLSLTAPAAIYAGQTWNEMEGEKSASVAIGAGVAQAALDRLGLSFIFKGVGKAAPKELLEKATTELVKKGMTREAAEATVVAATRKEIAGFAGDAAAIAKNQLAAKKIFKDVVSRGAVGAGGEALTEALQESTAYLGATLGSDKQFNWNELNDRAIQAAVAGGTLGAAFAGPGGIYNAGAWADVAYRAAPAEAKRLSQAGKFADQEVREHGRVKSVGELAAETRARVAKDGVSNTFEERVNADKKRKKDRTWTDAIASTALNAPALWRGATRFIFNDDLKLRSRSARIAADMFGGSLQRTFSGSGFENEKHHRVSIYKNLIQTPQNFWNALSGNKRLNNTKKAELSAETYARLNAALDEDGNFNPDLVTGDGAAEVRQLGKELLALGDKMWQDQQKHNPDLGYIKNYLFKYKSLSKKAVSEKRLQFQQLLKDEYNYSDAEAKSLVDEILDNPEVNNIDEAFSVTQGGIVPGSHRARSLGMSENDAFADFMEQDVFANVSQAAKSAARYTTHRDFIGQNGEVLAKLLDDMQAEGLTEAEVDKIAAQMQDFLDAESGNYKRPTSDAGKAAMRLQKNFMMLTTLAGLPLATVSSFVEIMLTHRGLTQDQIFGERGSLAAQGKNFAKTIWSGVNEVANAALRREGNPLDPTYGQERIRDLGFYDWDVGAATTTGVSETNPLQQHIYEQFFKWTGLQGWTNYTRAARATIAADFIVDKLDIISKSRESGEAKTNEVQEAEEGLRNLGINIEDMLNNPTDDVLATNMREATFNFVNDAVALPQSANRPLIYQDPRFALFTQFQGFIATFTANHIPKLWGEYVKRGTPAMKYNAFAVMTTMIMMGFVSQHLKDLIKYGGSTPYLDDAEYLQRGVRASGLLGTGERVLDQFFPLYEQRSDDLGSWVFNETTSQSPALSNLKRLGRAGGKLLEGDVGTAARYVSKSTPLVGPFNIATDFVGEVGSNWNFKGE